VVLGAASRTKVKINFPNVGKIARPHKLKNFKVTVNGRLGPAESVGRPSKKLRVVAAPETLFHFVQMPADLGHVTGERRGKRADCSGFLGKKFVANQITHFHRPSDLKYSARSFRTMSADV
jgi:hypothetical protein